MLCRQASWFKTPSQQLATGRRVPELTEFPSERPPQVSDGNNGARTSQLKWADRCARRGGSRVENRRRLHPVTLSLSLLRCPKASLFWGSDAISPEIRHSAGSGPATVVAAGSSWKGASRQLPKLRPRVSKDWNGRPLPPTDSTCSRARLGRDGF